MVFIDTPHDTYNSTTLKPSIGLQNGVQYYSLRLFFSLKRVEFLLLRKILNDHIFPVPLQGFSPMEFLIVDRGYFILKIILT